MDDFDALVRAAARTEVCTANYPGFNPPTQDRTRQKTDLIVAATAFLLQHQIFADITIQDIAQTAGCSITSIYARFNSKEAILPAVHLVTLENYRHILADKINTANFVGKSIEDFSRAYVRVISDYFEININFVSAVSVSFSTIVNDQFLQTLDAHALRIGTVMSQILGVPLRDLTPSTRFSILQIVHVFRSEITFSGTISAIKVDALSRLFTMIIKERLT